MAEFSPLGHQRGYYEYRTATGVGANCRLLQQCTKSKTGRTLNRHEHQHLLDRARRQSRSRAGKLDRQRRQHLQERNFADAANHHGFKRSRWRGLWRQSIQDLLIAAGQNLRQLTRTLLSSRSPLNISVALYRLFLTSLQNFLADLQRFGYGLSLRWKTAF